MADIGNVKNENITNNSEKKQVFRKKLLKVFAMLIIIVLMIVVAAMAWFTYNKYLEVTGAGMRSTGLKFDLAAKMSKGYYDDMLNYVEYGDKISDIYHDGLTVYDSDGNKTNNKLTEGYITGTYSEIKWAMHEEQNMRNYYSGLTRSEANTNDATRLSVDEESFYALEPGSEGVLEFYVVPKEDGVLNLNFEFDIDLFDLTANKTLSEENAISLRDDNKDDRQQRIFMRHILFFRDRVGSTNDGYRYKGLINYKNEESGGSLYFDDDYKLYFTDTIEDAKTGSAYKYSIYWVWPYLLGQVLVPNNSPVLNRYHAIFDDDKEKEAYVNDMKNDYVNYYYGYSENDIDFSNNPDNGDEKTGSNVFTEGNVGDIIKDVSEGKFLISDPDNNYSRLSYFWNKADQFLGVNIGFVTAEVIVSE